MYGDLSPAGVVSLPMQSIMGASALHGSVLKQSHGAANKSHTILP
jgi:hypothetical protein